MLRYEANEFIPGRSNLNPNISSFIPESLNPQSNMAATKIQSLSRGRQSRKKSKKKSDAIKKIQSLTRGRQSRKKTQKHKDFMETFNDTLDPNVSRKIFFESVLGDDIEDRRDSLEELEKEKTRNKDKMIALNKSVAFNPNYSKLEDTGIFKRDNDDSTYFTKEGELVEYDDYLSRFRDGESRDRAREDLLNTGVRSLVPNLEFELDSDSSDYAQKKYLSDWANKNENKKTDIFNEERSIIDNITKKTQQIGELANLDIFKCKKIKKMLDADPKLYYDPEITVFSDQCRNDMTRIFFDSYFKINWRLILPTIYGSDWSIEAKINKFPNDKFTKSAKNALIDVLIDEGLFNYERTVSTTENRFDVLANYFKWARVRTNTELQHLPQAPRMRSPIDGKIHLNRVLDLFEETILSRNIKDKSPEKIERMKRYFILSLIGLDDPHHYKFMLEQKIFIKNRQLISNKNIQINIDIDIVYLKQLIDGNITDEDGPVILTLTQDYGSLEDALEHKMDELNKFKEEKYKLLKEQKEQKDILEYVDELLNQRGGAVILGTAAITAKALPLAKSAIHAVASHKAYDIYESKFKNKSKKKSKKKSGKKNKKSKKKKKSSKKK